MNCPFCNINEEKTKIVKTKKNVFVALSNPRLMEGHLLVIPKRHVERISELNEEEKRELFDTVLEFQEKIIRKLSLGCDIRQNYRPFQGQNKLKVDHLHIHLQPREFEDKLYKKCQVFEKNIFQDLSSEESDKITQIFREG